MSRKNEEKVAKARRSVTKINSEAKLRSKPKDPPGTKYRCTSCGEFFESQGSFYKSSSPLFAGNNGYYPVCKNCFRNYFDYLTEYFEGNEEKSLDRACAVIDIYYADDISAVSNKSSGTHRFSSYISRSQMQQYSRRGSTYLDTIRDRAFETIDSFEDLEEANETGESAVSNAAFLRWGPGFTPEEYSLMDSHHRILKTQASDDDPMQEIYIKDMCVIRVLQYRAQKEDNVDNYDKLQKSYQNTAKAANLKSVSKSSDINNPDEAWGVFNSLVEQYTPADLYKRPKLFRDIDGIGGYYNRFIVRPFRNFFTGAREQDPKYSVGLGDDDG